MVGSIYAAVAAWVILGNNGEGERILPGPQPSPTPPLLPTVCYVPSSMLCGHFPGPCDHLTMVFVFSCLLVATGWTWRSYVVVAAAPVFITLALVIGIMPESPRYLLAKQKYHEVAKMLSK